MSFIYDIEHNILVNTKFVVMYTISKDVKTTNKWFIVAHVSGVGLVPVEELATESEAKDKLETYRMVEGNVKQGRILDA